MPGSDGPENLKILKMSQFGVDFGPCRQTAGLSASMADSWSWVPTMIVRSWGPTMVLRNWDSTTRCAERWGVVSIVWYERLLRIVSLLVSKNQSQKLIKRSYLNNRVACVFVLYGLHMYYGYTTQCRTDTFLLFGSECVFVNILYLTCMN